MNADCKLPCASRLVLRGTAHGDAIHADPDRDARAGHSA